MSDQELVTRVASSTGLTETEAARVITDVVAYYDEPIESVVRRRHRELQLRGLKNEAIFLVIRDELARRVVAPPELSDRQLRRLIYG